MCGRFAMKESAEKVTERFEVQESLLTLRPRYNVAPSQSVGVILDNGVRSLEGLKWGLIPSWSKDPKIGNKLINARGETLAEKPSFRAAYKRRRCLIPSTGFYEWRKEGSQRLPMYIHLKDHELFGMAGLWEEWQAPDGSIVRTFTIITIPPNGLMETIHHRMPAILKPADESMWLDPSLQNSKELQPLLQPYPAEAMTAHSVSKHVNSPANDDAHCIEPDQENQ